MPGTRNQATSVADDFRIFATCRNLISPLTDRLTSAPVMVHNTRPRSWTRPMWNSPNPRDSHVGRGRPTGHSTGHTLAGVHAFPFPLPGHRPLKAEIASSNPAHPAKYWSACPINARFGDCPTAGIFSQRLAVPQRYTRTTGDLYVRTGRCQEEGGHRPDEQPQIAPVRRHRKLQTPAVYTMPHFYAMEHVPWHHAAHLSYYRAHTCRPSLSRSSKTTIGNPWTRRKSVSLVMKSAQPTRRAIAAWRASGVLKPV